MSQDAEDWGTRLADVRVPSWYGVYVVVLALGALVGSLRRRREWDDATDSLTEVAEPLAKRMVEGDKRDDRMAELTESLAAMTERMEGYGRVSVRLAATSLAVAVAALVVAVVVAIAR